MKTALKCTTALVAATLVMGSLHSPANALKLFGDGGIIRGDVGRAVEKAEDKVVKPIVKAVERTAKEVGKTLEAGVKTGLAISGAKTLEDTIIEGKSLEQSVNEALEDVKEGAVVAADSFAIPNHIENSLAEVAANTLGADAGQAVSLLYMPGQVARSMPGAGARALISTSENIDNAEDIVAMPLGAALLQAKQYYEPKAKPLPQNMLTLLGYTFTADHLSNVRYVIDADGGNIAGIINALQEQLGDGNGRGNHAVAIDNIIVFQKEPEGARDLFFWGHEVQHTVQYSKMGIEGFASEYAANHNALEADADAIAAKAVENVKNAIAKTKELAAALN